ncbi:uncharacterized protein LACBIDRAFT_296326 [Laccaria bicolor S238N-H82]|uniref:Predicted protein n=1 Tax=Laccaria bicolor (strain S238N-H82 / ATCC MYA-4686) TaxID=486041 RepID=B0D8I5_LACBS|nr:uncharacterized protein LACBIDRAFT_296326 [Laccaria bicolor S238N-H82]EDR09083.1 predicted protein [Laccaria bicolor S238N-H82]|eukprot:XP_001880396.1 predicted protein [Laccaria bicolor S238N-H82]
MFMSCTVASKPAELAARASRIPPTPGLVLATTSHGQSTQQQPQPSCIQSPLCSQTPSCSQSRSRSGSPSHSCLGSPSRSHSHSVPRTNTAIPGLRSGSPQSGEKCTCLLDDDSDEDGKDEEADHHHDHTPAAVHVLKLNNDNSRPKAGDYDSSTQDTILGAPLVLDADIAKIIKACGSQAYGEAKAKTQTLVDVLYGFNSGCGRSVIKKNHDKAERLKHEKGFIYKSSQGDVPAPDHSKSCQWHVVQVVFASSVQSGFLPPKCATVDRNRSRTNPDTDGTESNHLGPVFCSLWSRFRPIQTGFLRIIYYTNINHLYLDYYYSEK